MHADLFGHFLDHHWFQVIGAVLEEVGLAADDDLADAQDGVLALLDALHQLQSCGEALFDVGADFAVGGVAGQQAAINGAQAKLRHIVVVHENLPAVVHLAKVHVGLDEARLRLVVAQARARIESPDHVHGALDQFDGAIEGTGYFLELIALHQAGQRIVGAG
jgi:hypothetical protein